MRRFVGHYGAEPKEISITWKLLAKSGWLKKAGLTPKPKHLLWALHFLKSYDTEESNAVWAEYSEPTFAKWAWFYSEGIAKLEKKVVS